MIVGKFFCVKWGYLLATEANVTKVSGPRCVAASHAREGADEQRAGRAVSMVNLSKKVLHLITRLSNETVHVWLRVDEPNKLVFRK